MKSKIRDEVEDMYLDASCTLMEKIAEHELKSDPAPKPKEAEKPTQTPMLCMPQAKLDTFSGEDPTQWLSFFTRYRTMVHDKQWDTSYKFDVLHQSLSGEATRQIKDLELSDENYQGV